MIRAFDHQDFDAGRLVEAKAGRTVSVCLPAHNESTTVGQIVRIIREQLVERHALVDELIVIDDHSTDDTARVARDAGATVERAGSESEAWLSLPPDDLASQVGAMVEDQAAEWDYRLKAHVHKFRGAISEVKTNISDAVCGAAE